jgi:uncharacterized protein (DUF4415 family)
MKQRATSRSLFDPAKVAAAEAAAPDAAVADPENPVSGEWDGAVKTHWGGVQATVTELREARRRGAQKAPVKVPTTIRIDADVVEALKASGKGWQTRVNEALRDLAKNKAA